MSLYLEGSQDPLFFPQGQHPGLSTGAFFSRYIVE